VLTPILAAAGAPGLVQGEGPLAWIAVVAFAVGAVEGLGGLYFHLRGASYMVGGLTLRNLMAGPPPVLPIAYSLAGVAGLMGLLLHD
jgi:hypothetical protein